MSVLVAIDTRSSIQGNESSRAQNHENMINTKPNAVHSYNTVHRINILISTSHRLRWMNAETRILQSSQQTQESYTCPCAYIRKARTRYTTNLLVLNSTKCAKQSVVFGSTDTHSYGLHNDEQFPTCGQFEFTRPSSNYGWEELHILNKRYWNA